MLKIGRHSTATQTTQMTSTSSTEFEPYCIEANARTMAEFAAAMMRAIAKISVEHYGITPTPSEAGDIDRG